MQDATRRATRSSRSSSGASSSGRTRGRRPGRALHVPDSLRDLLGGRLARLPAETVDVLVQVAALARPTVQLVSATYGDEERVIEALEAAVREGVVESDESRIRFAHPLLASICYDQAPVWKRRAVHRALAGAVSDVEERARHLALAADGPDPEIASELDRAAEQAAARGAPATAGELSDLAAELTSDDPTLALHRRLHSATYHRLAGDGERAVATLNELLREAPSRCRAGGRPLRARADAQSERPEDHRALQRGVSRGGQRRGALDEDSRVPELHAPVPGGRSGGAGRRKGRVGTGRTGR